MKKQNGVTLTTLSIYIIVATILLGTLSFININIMSELGELTKRSKSTDEIIKFYGFLVKDLKSAHNVLEFSDSYIRLDSGVQYQIKYRSNEKKDNQTYNVYEIYRGEALISDKFSGVFFDYNQKDNYINVKVYTSEEDVLKADEQYFKIGRGY